MFITNGKTMRLVTWMSMRVVGNVHKTVLDALTAGFYRIVSYYISMSMSCHCRPEWFRSHRVASLRRRIMLMS